jgi:hypothetical protein
MRELLDEAAKIWLNIFCLRLGGGCARRGEQEIDTLN